MASSAPPTTVARGRRRPADADADAAPARPRRSALAQERSRQTRRRLVRAAFDLWNERGFDEGIEATTVDEIARAAGVTKGTFYFHFAHKEDILLEMGWGTSESMRKDVLAALARDEPTDVVLDRLMVTVARRMTQTPRAAVARTVAEFYRRRPHRTVDTALSDGEHGSFRSAFVPVFRRGIETGELPADADPSLVAEMLQTLMMGAIRSWTLDEQADLVAMFRYRAQVVVVGARGARLVDEAP